MSEKSYVTMEQHACVVCGQPYDTGSLLLDRRLRKTFDMKTVTGFGMCPEHEKLRAEGYVALVECDPAKTQKQYSADYKDGKPPQETVKPQDAYRTGNICHLRKAAFERVMNVPVPEKMVCFVEPGVIDALRKRQAPE